MAKKKKTGFKAFVATTAKVIILVGVFAAAGYGVNTGMTQYFSEHFYPKTVINGEICSGLSVDQVKEKLQYHVEDYSIDVVELGGNTTTLTGSEIGLTYVDDGSLEQLLKDQGKSSWIFNLNREHVEHVESAASYDHAKLRNLLGSWPCFDEEQTVAPQDAYIADDGSKYVIVPEVIGNRINTEIVLDAIIDAVDAGQDRINLDQRGFYQKPTVFSDSDALIEEMNQMNIVVAANITYDFVDRTYTVGRDQIMQWAAKGEDGKYVVNRDAVYEWVRQMAYETDTFGLGRDFTTSTGRTIRLPAGGDYGWYINKDKTTDELVEAINSGYNGNKDPIYIYWGRSRTKNDIGGTYVEVCIKSQTMWCYKNGELVVKTSVVTGNHSTGHDTPAGGCWAIDAKKRDFNFTKYRAHADFWMPFNDAVGIHDANWRSDFGGEIYMTSGSHGCVNTPHDNAEKIFDVMNIGDPVIVYYSEDDVVGYQPTQENS